MKFFEDLLRLEESISEEKMVCTIPREREGEITLSLTNAITPLEMFAVFGGMPEPEKVIFSNPATIVYWNDNTKTVVKCGEEDTYDKEKGLALCYMKKFLGNKGNYNDTLKKWCGEAEPSVHWIKGKEFYKCSKCGCEVIHPVLKCPKCESKILEVKNGR